MKKFTYSANVVGYTEGKVLAKNAKEARRKAEEALARRHLVSEDNSIKVRAYKAPSGGKKK